jgi:hypothetical protein
VHRVDDFLEARSRNERRMRSTVFWSFPVLLFLCGCDAKPECDSFETRNAVLKTISEDHRNALAEYAAKNSDAVKSGSVGPDAEKSQQPLYILGQKIVTTSASADKRTLKCSGSISATVAETKASKEINFTVQRSEGKTTVSVDPFQF